MGAAEEVKYAQQLGIDVIVTDHHQVGTAFPHDCPVLNPKRPDCPYPFKELAGVGVAFKLVQALLSICGPKDGRTTGSVLNGLLDLVALGTVADVVPLLDENRVLTTRGLEVLNSTQRPGLRELAIMAGLRLGMITPTTIGYVLAPRLNSAGRIGDPLKRYELLTTRSVTRARELAEYLEATNAERQNVMNQAVARAREAIAASGIGDVLIVESPEFPAGVVGLVAGKLVEEFYRPAVVLEQGMEQSRGSARSIAELDITSALENCRDLLHRFGGHPQAAGFTISNDNLEAFKERLTNFVRSELQGRLLRPRIFVDCELPLHRITFETHKLVERLAPFGYGNPAPTFLARGIRILESRALGRETPKHLQLKLHDGKHQCSAFAFNRGSDIESVPPGTLIDIVYSFEPSEYGGTIALNLQVKDWRPSIGRTVGRDSQ